jgi:hypothetical protein
MVNPFNDVNWRPDPRALRRFAVSIAIGVPVLAAFAAGKDWLFRGRVHEWSIWAAGAGVALGLLFRAVPRLGYPVYMAWYFLGCCIGFVVSNLFLVAFFYLVVTPVGMLLRAFGHDPLDRRGGSQTYWRDFCGKPPASRYLRQY